jgi:4-hydroxy-3-methylbut-2-en-1-yl diphosphate synthase IspG/GcpE
MCCRYDVPLVADIHFQPAVAMMVADAFEKVRPGGQAADATGVELVQTWHW